METAIFVFRILLSSLLYVFLATLFVFLWRDLKSVTQPQMTTSVRERPAQLRVIHGSNGLIENEICALSAYTSIGRSAKNSIKIAETYASAEHALIVWRNTQWWLEDRSSRNGTLLNDVPITAPLIISQGDVIGIGQLRLKFEYLNELDNGKNGSSTQG
ncbi:MAG TPA: FHA domain-containing protein [Anaerolineae bacterium]|nr:FHA domain-containing protein [Anaerolineae bacterium]